MRLVLVLVLASLAGLAGACKGERAKQEERCVALMKKEESCVRPVGELSAEARAIKGATHGNAGYSKLGAAMCMHQFDDPSTLDGADQKLAAHYKALLACGEKTRTCDEYLTCACQDPTTYIQCAQRAPK